MRLGGGWGGGLRVKCHVKIKKGTQSNLRLILIIYLQLN